MQVYEVTDGMVVQPNCAYIIPPNRDMAFLNGALQLLEQTAPRGMRLPIDFFFRSLAQDQHERAICIVLSGTGSDGTLGVRAIKGEGGMVMAQNPDSTEYDGMPRSAIATGLVDYELPPAEMPAQLIAYVAHAFGKSPRPATAPPPKAESALKKIFILLRAQTGHDFSQYKPSTINRRIERRMAVHQTESMDGYVKYLQQMPAEVEALFRDLLIGVTSFFRDPEAFKALEEQVIPKLFAGKPAGGMIRVWSPGCSTGEEAYSLAILLAERREELRQSFKVQVFGTDIDSQAIATARAGLYPASIAADISPERLARFFTAEPDGGAYRIHKAIRDLLVFSEQNMIQDPPFSKVDLVSCRNLLIYMGGDLQKKIMPLFHYALNEGGFLFLGTSETVGEFGNLFAALDRKLKLYQRKEVFHGAQHVAPDRFLPSMMAMDAAIPRAAAKKAGPGELPLRELTEQALLQQVAPAAVLVNGHGDILYIHGRTGMYLEPSPGAAGVSNILKMVREGLRHDLTTALHKAATGKEIVRCPSLSVRTNGDFTTVNLTVRPVATGPATTPKAPLYLVILEHVPPDLEPAQNAAALKAGEGVDGPDTDANARIAALKQELRAKEEYLQAAFEELETSNEELKSSNEEMQSVNEEMQSTNEELETSKEELQSVNEELATVNAELQTKVADLSRASNDMNNLFAGTGIGSIFVDHQLRILRFTPAATRIINLIQSDTGRSVGHIVSNLAGYDNLVADTQTVLDTLVPKEVEVRTKEGQWHTMRIVPYRTLDNVIEGAVITFVNITEMKQVEAERIKLEHQLQQARKAESLGRMAGAIAHHFNNKLMVVTGNLELALIHAGPNRELSTHLLEAQRATAQAADVSGLMLAYLGQALPKVETFDLAKVCCEVTEAQKSFIPERVALKVEIPAHGPTIKANQTQVRQVLSNLIVNAWEAIGEGDGEIHASLCTVEAAGTTTLRIFPADWQSGEDSYACLEVSDSGCGISPEQLDLIFDPFYSTKFTGRGLGLAVALGTVRSYGGAIAVESEPGRGSIFRVFWPIVEPEAQPVQQEETVASRPIIGSGLVLFVDDEVQLRNMAEVMLGLLDFAVIKAAHAGEAIEIFRTRKDEISLVILDLTMPGMNGWETLAALRALRPDIPVVLASGYDEAKVMEGRHTELPQAFLHKPYSMVELEAALGAAMAPSSPQKKEFD
jgi:two-component system, chemotaxis family, CheB/CheR fusion protein